MAQKYLDMSGLTRYHEGLLNYMENEKGVADGIATLDENGLIPEEQLPMEVMTTDDVDSIFSL